MPVKNAIARAWSPKASRDGLRWSIHPGGTRQSPQLDALVFPSNLSGSDQSAPIVALKFSNPHSNGFPFWGDSNAGVTIVRRVWVTQQTGYYAMFWYSDDNSFEDSKTGGKGYYGFHPYPQSASSAGTTHDWEIASDDGGDFRASDAGPNVAVTYNRWYKQAITIQRNGVNSKTLKFYTDLDDVRPETIITAAVTFASYGENNPPQVNPRITIGDSPWYGTYQHERFSGKLREHIIFSGIVASQDDCINQGALLNGASTTLLSTLAPSIWHGWKGFSSVDDLTCQFGTGRSFSWIDTGNKGTLGSPV